MKRTRTTGVAKRLEYLRERLVARRQQLLEALQSRLAVTQALSDTVPGDVSDEAARALDQDTAYSLAQMGANEISQIDEALRRMDAGSYGRCVYCERDIPLRRLMVMPFATHCVKCQELHERESADRSAGSLASWARVEDMPQDMPDMRAFLDSLREHMRE